MYVVCAWLDVPHLAAAFADHNKPYHGLRPLRTVGLMGTTAVDDILSLDWMASGLGPLCIAFVFRGATDPDLAGFITRPVLLQQAMFHLSKYA